VVLLIVYAWVAGVFPVAHAAAEASPPAITSPADGSSPGPLPVGHDHLTCHFCATAGSLVATAPDHAVPVATFEAAAVAPAPSLLPSITLAWTHHAIPSRAPPSHLT
jgi:hypothetical protein